MKTQEQLIRRALQLLGAVSSDEPISAENRAAVQEQIEPMLDDLRLRQIWDNGFPTEFDDGPYLYLSIILASHCAPHFGSTIDGAAIENAERMLRHQLTPVLDASPVPVWPRLRW